MGRSSVLVLMVVFGSVIAAEEGRSSICAVYDKKKENQCKKIGCVWDNDAKLCNKEVGTDGPPCASLNGRSGACLKTDICIWDQTAWTCVLDTKKRDDEGERAPVLNPICEIYTNKRAQACKTRGCEFDEKTRICAPRPGTTGPRCSVLTGKPVTCEKVDICVYNYDTGECNEAAPTEKPTDPPTEEPLPTAIPTPAPEPTADPTEAPAPTADPTEAPAPTADPTEAPAPTADPTEAPAPTADPTEAEVDVGMCAILHGKEKQCGRLVGCVYSDGKCIEEEVTDTNDAICDNLNGMEAACKSVWKICDWDADNEECNKTVKISCDHHHRKPKSCESAAHCVFDKDSRDCLNKSSERVKHGCNKYDGNQRMCHNAPKQSDGTFCVYNRKTALCDMLSSCTDLTAALTTRDIEFGCPDLAAKSDMVCHWNALIEQCTEHSNRFIPCKTYLTKKSCQKTGKAAKCIYGEMEDGFGSCIQPEDDLTPCERFLEETGCLTEGCEWLKDFGMCI